MEGVQRGYDEVRAYHFDDDRYPEIPFDSESGGWGWKTAPIGGVNPIPGSSVRNDLSASREGYLPLFEPENAFTAVCTILPVRIWCFSSSPVS